MHGKSFFHSALNLRSRAALSRENYDLYTSFTSSIDYEATVKAAQEAQGAAQAAQNNAAEAGAKASISGITDYGSSHGASSYTHIQNGSGENHGSVHSSYDAAPANSNRNDQTAKSSSPKHSKEALASNHNYGISNNNDFKPSKPFNFAGYKK